MSEWINFSERRPDSFPCFCSRRMKDGAIGIWLFEAPTRRLLASRWKAWIAFKWEEQIPYHHEEKVLIGPLPEAHRSTFQVAAEFFRRLPPLTYEEKLEQFRRSKEQRARMEK